MWRGRRLVYYLRQGRYVLLAVCLSVCLSVSRISQQVYWIFLIKKTYRIVFLVKKYIKRSKPDHCRYRLKFKRSTNTA